MTKIYHLLGPKFTKKGKIWEFFKENKNYDKKVKTSKNFYHFLPDFAFFHPFYVKRYTGF